MAYSVEPRGASRDLLHELVKDGLPRLVAALADEDRHLPGFVVRELEGYLHCGDVANGFGWLVCDDCPHHRLVAFSCKGRGFCPSCISRRTDERSARWVDALFPHRRVRQWVLTVPWPRRWLFARQHPLARGVLGEAMAEIQSFYAIRAGGGKTGSVTVIQRFGSALPLNIHFHLLAVDGSFERQPDGTVLWRASPPPTTEEIERLVEAIARRAEAWLARKGFGRDDEDFVYVRVAVGVIPNLGGRNPREDPRRAEIQVVVRGGRNQELVCTIAVRVADARDDAAEILSGSRAGQDRGLGRRNIRRIPTINVDGPL